MILTLLFMPMSMSEETERTWNVDADVNVDVDGLVAAKQRVRLVPVIPVITQHYNTKSTPNHLSRGLVRGHQNHDHHPPSLFPVTQVRKSREGGGLSTLA